MIGLLYVGLDFFGRVFGFGLVDSGGFRLGWVGFRLVYDGLKDGLVGFGYGKGKGGFKIARGNGLGLCGFV